MKKYKNKIIIVLIIIAIIFSSYTYIKVKTEEEGNKASYNVLKESFEYENNKELDSLLNCYTEDFNKDSFNLENLNFKNVSNIKLIDNKSNLYKVYLTYGKGKTLKISKNSLRIYSVEYYLQYNDEKEAEDKNGFQTKKYYLVKQDDNWKISSIGD